MAIRSEFVDRSGNGMPPANTSWRLTGGVEPISQRVLHAGLTIRDAGGRSIALQDAAGILGNLAGAAGRRCDQLDQHEGAGRHRLSRKPC